MKNSRYNPRNSFDQYSFGNGAFSPVDSMKEIPSSENTVKDLLINSSVSNKSPSNLEEVPSFIIVNENRHIPVPIKEPLTTPSLLTDREIILPLSSPPRPLAIFMKTFLIFPIGPASIAEWIFLTSVFLFPTLISGTRKTDPLLTGFLPFPVSYLFPLTALFYINNTLSKAQKILTLSINEKGDNVVPKRVENTSSKINDRSIPKTTYTFYNQVNVEYKTFASTLDVSRRTKDGPELVLYDKHNPKNAIIFNELPGKFKIRPNKKFHFTLSRYSVLIPTFLFLIFFIGEHLIFLALLFTGCNQKRLLINFCVSFLLYFLTDLGISPLCHLRNTSNTNRIKELL